MRFFLSLLLVYDLILGDWLERVGVVCLRGWGLKSSAIIFERGGGGVLIRLSWGKAAGIPLVCGLAPEDDDGVERYQTLLVHHIRSKGFKSLWKTLPLRVNPRYY